jgi:hypothetical protein
LVAPSTLSEKLASAVPYHFKEADDYREFRKDMLRDLAGRTTYPGYDNDLDANPEKHIVNLTMQAKEAFTMTLAATAPKFLCSSEDARYDHFAERYERALDRYSRTIGMGKVLKQIVEDAFVLVGIAKVYQASSLAVSHEVDYRMDANQPFLQRMCLDRFVWDTSATSPETASFMGDYYSMPFREAVRSKRFSPKVRAMLRERGPEQDGSHNDRGENLATGQNQQTVEDLIYLLDVFVRQPIKIDGKRYKSHVRTYICDRNLNFQFEDTCVQKVGWDGAECGPYYFLNMGPVADHFMPSSPGQNQRLLCQFYNTLYRKLEQQARRQKNIGVAAKGSGDHEIARDMRDGEFGEFQEPAAVDIKRMDGPDQNIFGLAIHAGELHSQANGNLKMKLGAAANAETATQQGMLAAASSQLDAAHKESYIAFLRDCAHGLAKLIYRDSKLRIPGTLSIEGTNTPITVPDDWIGAGETYEDGSPSREGDEACFFIDIDPESTRFRSAAEKLAELDKEVQTWLPHSQMLAQMGAQIDVKQYFDSRARLTGIPELRRIFKTGQTPLVLQGGSSGAGASGGGPNGEYHHTSSSTRSPESEAMQYFQASPAQGAA